MFGLKVRDFSKKEESSMTNDFSHLENNKNFKSEEIEEEIIEGEEVEEEIINTDEPNEDSLESDEPEIDSEEVVEIETETLTEEELKAKELENNIQEPTELTDELLFEKLSEKLGREVNSLEDLKPQEIVDPLEEDADIKAIYDWKKKTGRPLEEFFKYQKDYSEMSDIDVAREFLQVEYPTLTAEEVNLELEGYSADDLDSSVESAKKGLELKKYAVKGRQVLDGLKAKLSDPSENVMTSEVKDKLKFIDGLQAKMEKDTEDNKNYNESLVQASSTTESISLSLTDDLSIDFTLKEESRNALPNLVNEMPHWKNEDGTWNHQAIIRDGAKIQNFDKMIRLAFEQGLNSGEDKIIKEAKNSTLGDGKTNRSIQEEGGKKRPTYENLDKILSGNTMGIKFGGN